jgi:hypothetical protein
MQALNAFWKCVGNPLLTSAACAAALQIVGG